MPRWEAYGGWWSDIMHIFPPLLGWVQANRPSWYWERRRAWWMVGVGGGEVVLWITGVQKTKKEKAKILPVDQADS